MVVWAQSCVARRPEARAVPVDDQSGPSIGLSRDRSWTRDLVAGNLEKSGGRVNLGDSKRWYWTGLTSGLLTSLRGPLPPV